MSYDTSKTSTEFYCKCGNKGWLVEGEITICPVCQNGYLGKYDKKHLTIKPIFMKLKKYVPNLNKNNR